MNSGLYAALSGNLAAMRRLDVISNNLANANTAGFKGDRLQFESVLASSKSQTQQPGTLSDSPVFSGEKFFTDYSPGPLTQTGNTLDLALNGDGFFVVTTPQGRAYTRQGNFRLDAGGRLVTSEGYQVQGNGPITISGGQVDIDAKGAILVDGTPVGTLEVVDFPKPYNLQKLGEGLFVPINPQDTPVAVTATTVQQGALEGSNVNVVAEMVRLIETTRYFESCQKVVRSYDDLTGKAANDLGRV
ncbi:flagellar basal-body rod protein FlgF [Geotalea sp. SG265]|uniref:flagellar basal-body rod protein FlgF n=1 Tax=Geotalea sp. SG265 TaxID=2922867 RepID=UPI001FAF587A|nr:flagellar basal-body rod protein FlgF [Geotalea sp. SG265]